MCHIPSSKYDEYEIQDESSFPLDHIARGKSHNHIRDGEPRSIANAQVWLNFAKDAPENTKDPVVTQFPHYQHMASLNEVTNDHVDHPVIPPQDFYSHNIEHIPFSVRNRLSFELPSSSMYNSPLFYGGLFANYIPFNHPFSNWYSPEFVQEILKYYQLPLGVGTLNRFPLREFDEDLYHPPVFAEVVAQNPPVIYPRNLNLEQFFLRGFDQMPTKFDLDDFPMSFPNKYESLLTGNNPLEEQHVPGFDDFQPNPITHSSFPFRDFEEFSHNLNKFHAGEVPPIELPSHGSHEFIPYVDADINEAFAHSFAQERLRDIGFKNDLTNTIHPFDTDADANLFKHIHEAGVDNSLNFFPRSQEILVEEPHVNFGHEEIVEDPLHYDLHSGSVESNNYLPLAFHPHHAEFGNYDTLHSTPHLYVFNETYDDENCESYVDPVKFQDMCFEEDHRYYDHDNPVHDINLNSYAREGTTEDQHAFNIGAETHELSDFEFFPKNDCDNQLDELVIIQEDVDHDSVAEPIHYTYPEKEHFDSNNFDRAPIEECIDAVAEPFEHLHLSEEVEPIVLEHISEQDIPMSLIETRDHLRDVGEADHEQSVLEHVPSEEGLIVEHCDHMFVYGDDPHNSPTDPQNHVYISEEVNHAPGVLEHIVNDDVHAAIVQPHNHVCDETCHEASSSEHILVEEVHSPNLQLYDHVLVPEEINHHPNIIEVYIPQTEPCDNVYISENVNGEHNVLEKITREEINAAVELHDHVPISHNVHHEPNIFEHIPLEEVRAPLVELCDDVHNHESIVLEHIPLDEFHASSIVQPHQHVHVSGGTNDDPNVLENIPQEKVLLIEPHEHLHVLEELNHEPNIVEHTSELLVPLVEPREHLDAHKQGDHEPHTIKHILNEEVHSHNTEPLEQPHVFEVSNQEPSILEHISKEDVPIIELHDHVLEEINPNPNSLEAHPIIEPHDLHVLEKIYHEPIVIEQPELHGAVVEPCEHVHVLNQEDQEHISNEQVHVHFIEPLEQIHYFEAANKEPIMLEHSSNEEVPIIKLHDHEDVLEELNPNPDIPEAHPIIEPHELHVLEKINHEPIVIDQPELHGAVVGPCEHVHVLNQEDQEHISNEQVHVHITEPLEQLHVFEPSNVEPSILEHIPKEEVPIVELYDALEELNLNPNSLETHPIIEPNELNVLEEIKHEPNVFQQPEVHGAVGEPCEHGETPNPNILETHSLIIEPHEQNVLEEVNHEPNVFQQPELHVVEAPEYSESPNSNILETKPLIIEPHELNVLEEINHEPNVFQQPELHGVVVEPCEHSETSNPNILETHSLIIEPDEQNILEEVNHEPKVFQQPEIHGVIVEPREPMYVHKEEDHDQLHIAEDISNEEIHAHITKPLEQAHIFEVANQEPAFLEHIPKEEVPIVKLHEVFEELNPNPNALETYQIIEPHEQNVLEKINRGPNVFQQPEPHGAVVEPCEHGESSNPNIIEPHEVNVLEEVNLEPNVFQQPEIHGVIVEPYKPTYVQEDQEQLHIAEDISNEEVHAHIVEPHEQVHIFDVANQEPTILEYVSNEEFPIVEPYDQVNILEEINHVDIVEPFQHLHDLDKVYHDGNVLEQVLTEEEHVPIVVPYEHVYGPENLNHDSNICDQEPGVIPPVIEPHDHVYVVEEAKYDPRVPEDIQNDSVQVSISEPSELVIVGDTVNEPNVLEIDEVEPYDHAHVPSHINQNIRAHIVESFEHPHVSEEINQEPNVFDHVSEDHVAVIEPCDHVDVYEQGNHGANVVEHLADEKVFIPIVEQHEHEHVSEDVKVLKEIPIEIAIAPDHVHAPQSLNREETVFEQIPIEEEHVSFGKPCEHVKLREEVMSEPNILEDNPMQEILIQVGEQPHEPEEIALEPDGFEHISNEEVVVPVVELSGQEIVNAEPSIFETIPVQEAHVHVAEPFQNGYVSENLNDGLSNDAIFKPCNHVHVPKNVIHESLEHIQNIDVQDQSFQHVEVPDIVHHQQDILEHAVEENVGVPLVPCEHEHVSAQTPKDVYVHEQLQNEGNVFDHNLEEEVIAPFVEPYHQELIQENGGHFYVNEPHECVNVQENIGHNPYTEGHGVAPFEYVYIEDTNHDSSVLTHHLPQDINVEHSHQVYFPEGEERGQIVDYSTPSSMEVIHETFEQSPNSQDYNPYPLSTIQSDNAHHGDPNKNYILLLSNFLKANQLYHEKFYSGEINKHVWGRPPTVDQIKDILCNQIDRASIQEYVDEINKSQANTAYYVPLGFDDVIGLWAKYILEMIQLNREGKSNFANSNLFDAKCLKERIRKLLLENVDYSLISEYLQDLKAQRGEISVPYTNEDVIEMWVEYIFKMIHLNSLFKSENEPQNNWKSIAGTKNDEGKIKNEIYDHLLNCIDLNYLCEKLYRLCSLSKAFPKANHSPKDVEIEHCCSELFGKHPLFDVKNVDNKYIIDRSNPVQGDNYEIELVDLNSKKHSHSDQPSDAQHHNDCLQETDAKVLEETIRKYILCHIDIKQLEHYTKELNEGRKGITSGLHLPLNTEDVLDFWVKYIMEVQNEPQVLHEIFEYMKKHPGQEQPGRGREHLNVHRGSSEEHHVIIDQTLPQVIVETKHVQDDNLKRGHVEEVFDDYVREIQNPRTSVHDLAHTMSELPLKTHEYDFVHIPQSAKHQNPLHVFQKPTQFEIRKVPEGNRHKKAPIPNPFHQLITTSPQSMPEGLKVSLFGPGKPKILNLLNREEQFKQSTYESIPTSSIILGNSKPHVPHFAQKKSKGLKNDRVNNPPVIKDETRRENIHKSSTPQISSEPHRSFYVRKLPDSKAEVLTHPRIPKGSPEQSPHYDVGHLRKIVDKLEYIKLKLDDLDELSKCRCNTTKNVHLFTSNERVINPHLEREGAYFVLAPKVCQSTGHFQETHRKNFPHDVDELDSKVSLCSEHPVLCKCGNVLQNGFCPSCAPYKREINDDE